MTTIQQQERMLDSVPPGGWPVGRRKPETTEWPLGGWLRHPNPVLVKEVRAVFRSWRGFAGVTGYLVFLAAIPWLTGRFFWGGPIDPSVASNIGRSTFGFTAAVEILAVSAVLPALTFGSLIGEVQRQTIDLLWATPLTSYDIVVGKLGAAAAYLLLLVFGGLPIIGISFLYGGVSPFQLVLHEAQLAAFGLLVAAVGIHCSSRFARSEIAAAVAYTYTLLLLGLPLVLVPFGLVCAPLALLGFVGVLMSPLVTTALYFAPEAKWLAATGAMLQVGLQLMLTRILVLSAARKLSRRRL